MRPSHREAEAERSLLSTLEAGCKAPVAGLARVRDGSLTLSAGVFSPDGSSALREESSGPAAEAVSIGRAAGRKLLERGAAAMIAAAEQVSLPRALVVRSGANPFARFTSSSRIEILEKSSHSIEPVEPDSALLESPADIAIFTSQVAVETLFADERRASLFRKATAGGIVVAVGPVTGEVLAAKNVAVTSWPPAPARASSNACPATCPAGESCCLAAKTPRPSFRNACTPAGRMSHAWSSTARSRGPAIPVSSGRSWRTPSRRSARRLLPPRDGSSRGLGGPRRGVCKRLRPSSWAVSRGDSSRRTASRASK